MVSRSKKVDGRSREAWAARIAALEDPQVEPRQPLTVQRVVAAGLQVVADEGYEAATMRRVATALDVTPGALYVHVRDRAQLDDLMIGRLSAEVEVPVPDAATWRDQFLDVCRQLRDRYRQYPGIAEAVFATAPDNLDSLRVTDGLYSIALVAEIPAVDAAWLVDAALLQVAAHSVVAVRRYPDGDEVESTAERAEMIERYRMLPSSRFPAVVAHAAELVSGTGDHRFDFAIRLLLDGITSRTATDDER